MTLEMSLAANVSRVSLVGNLRLQTPSWSSAKPYGVELDLSESGSICMVVALPATRDGILDVPSRRLIYVNAGHLPALLVSANGRIEPLEEGGIPLGLFDDPHYYEGFARMHAGDILALYSDGITEAEDIDEVPYGLERLTHVLQDARAGHAASIRDAVVRDLRRFAVDPRADDETLVISKATGPAT